MGMSGPKKGRGGAISEINVTPLVDVMLVLLIIFMVTAALMKVADEQERSVDMDIPVTRDNPETIDIENTDQLILEIDRNLVVTLLDETITDCSAALESDAVDRYEPCFVEIQEKLGLNYRLQQDEKIYLLADANIPYGFVVGTLARIRLAGVAEVGMVTLPEYIPRQQAEN